MKTAMQELQDALEIYSRHNKGTPEGKAIDITLSAFPKFIEAEKEQILMAFTDGKVSAIIKNQRTPEEYYNLTFKSDE